MFIFIRRYLTEAFRLRESFLAEVTKDPGVGRESRRNTLKNIFWRAPISLLATYASVGALLNLPDAPGMNLLKMIGFGIVARIMYKQVIDEIWARFYGDKDYQETFYAGIEDTGTLEGLVNTVTLRKQSGFERGGFFLESSFHITATAFAALRKGAESARAEMLRSCRLHSPVTLCEENVAMRELFRMSEGLLEGPVKAMMEHSATGEKNMIVPGRMAQALFFDPETNEPVMISWVRVELDPKSEVKVDAGNDPLTGELKSVKIRAR